MIYHKIEKPNIIIIEALTVSYLNITVLQFHMYIGIAQ